jgi:predicted MFS family arabinose efflux permease
VTITNLDTSRTAEIRDREKRYVIAMLFRAVCFVAAVLLFHGAARWIALAVAIFMPWFAVILANQPRVRQSRYARFVPAAPRSTKTLDAAREHQVIDVSAEDARPTPPVRPADSERRTGA